MEKTTLVEANKVGIEVDLEPGFEGFLILNLDGERYEFEVTPRLRQRLRTALDRSEEISAAASPE